MAPAPRHTPLPPTVQAAIIYQVWTYDYFHLVPYRGLCHLELWNNYQVNFIDDNGRASGPHGDWRVDSEDNIHITFHYAGEAATIRRQLLMSRPQSGGRFCRTLLNTNGLHPVAMFYRGTEHRACSVRHAVSPAPPGFSDLPPTPMTAITENMRIAHWPDLALQAVHRENHSI